MDRRELNPHPATATPEISSQRVEFPRKPPSPVVYFRASQAPESNPAEMPLRGIGFLSPNRLRLSKETNMPPHEHAQEHLHKANELATALNFNAAFREFETAIRRHYSNATAYADFGYALVAAGRYPEAIEQFKKAAEFDPDILLDVNQLATAFHHDIRQKQDREEFQKVVDSAGRDQLTHIWAQVLSMLDLSDQAIEEFKKALTKNPDLQLNTVNVAVALENSKGMEQQVQSFQQKVDELTNPQAWNTWGQVLLRLRRYTAAAHQFRMAADTKKDWAEPYKNLGRVFIELGDYEMALDTLRKALNYDDSSIQTYLDLSEALCRNKKFDEAVSNYKAAAAKAPSDRYLEPWLEAIKKLPNSDSAIDEYEKGLEKSIEPSAYVAFGKFLKQLGHFPESAIQFAKAVAFNGDDEVGNELRQILSDLDEPHDILETIDSIFNKTGEPERYSQWTSLLAQSNQVDRATQQLPRVLTELQHLVRPGTTFRSLALAFRSALNGSVAKFEEELKKIGSGGLQLEWAGILLSDLGERAHALDEYKWVLLNAPRTPRLVEELAAITSLSDYPSAKTDLQAAVNNISDPDVCYHWAMVLIQLGDTKAALPELERAISLDPTHVDAHYQLGMLYNRHGRSNKACQQFQKTLQFGGNLSGILYNWGTALLDVGKKEEAIEKYLEAVKNNGETFYSDHLLTIRDKLVWDNKILERFQQVFDEINNADSYRDWGVFLLQLKRPDSAIKQFKKAIELDPDRRQAYSEWLRALVTCRFAPERVEEYEQSILKYRKNADAYNEFADLLYRVKRTEEALQRYKQALDLDPKNSSARAGLIYCLLDLNHLKEARERAIELQADEPNNGTAYDCLSWCDFLDGRYQDAVSRCEVGIEHLDYYYLYDTCARALYKLGRREDALQKYDDALKERPDDVEILFNKVVMLMEMNRYEEATPILKAILVQQPGHAYANHNFAAVSYDRGRYEDAWGRWAQTLDVYNQQPLTRAIEEGKTVDINEAYNHAAVVFFVLQRPDEAEIILKEGLDFNPNNTLILGLLATLYWERKEELTALDADTSRRKSDCHKLGMDFFQKAERLLKQRSERYTNYYVLIELGELYILRADYEQARRCFEQANKADDSAYIPYAKLGVIDLLDRKPDKAIPSLLKALELNPDDLDVKSSLAEAYLRAEKLSDAESTYRQVLSLAPNHVQSYIGLGELCSALGDKKDYDRYSEAIDSFSKALEIADNEKIRSKYLKKTEKASVCYQMGYARVQTYENSGIRRDTKLLTEAQKDFDQCIALNPAHPKGRRAKEKIDKRLAFFLRDRFTETIGPRAIYRMSLAVFAAVQIAFFVAPLLNQPSFRVSYRSVRAIEKDLTAEQLETVKALIDQNFSNRETLTQIIQALPDKAKETVLQNVDTIKPVENAPDLPVGYYSLLTFGSLMFMVIGLYLPQILKLKVAGIELEKSSIDQATGGDQAVAASSLGIGKP
jgi:tetratricopeptide (TPR) repeat protein